MQAELIQRLKEISVIQVGDFVLRSGERSNYYCDVKKALGNPETLRAIAAELKALVPTGTTALAASGYGGIPIATALSLETLLPLCLVRDNPKDHGTKKTLDGYLPTADDVVLIVDDVFTTGSSVRHTAENLAPTGCTVSGALVVVQRGRADIGLSVRKLISDAELLSS